MMALFHGPKREQAPALQKGYTLIEMLTTVAALVIILGLMVSLARFVRYRSSTEMTQELLGRLAGSMDQYIHLYGRLPPIAPAVPPGENFPTEAQILADASENNADFVRALRKVQPITGGVLANLPASMYDERRLKDPWGGYILFMPHQHPAIGIAPNNGFFFFSAGPDRRYLTRDDNLYSYEGS